MRLAMFLALNLIFVSWILCSGLPVTDLARLLNEDWSVIERITAQHAASTSSQSSASVEQVDSDEELQDLIATFRARQQEASFRANLHRPSTSDQHAGAGYISPRIDRVGVQPTKPPAVIDRSEELKSVHAAIRQWNPSISKERKVMPLIDLYLPSYKYKEFYEQYLGHFSKKRYIWTRPSATYLLIKPVMGL